MNQTIFMMFLLADVLTSKIFLECTVPSGYIVTFLHHIISFALYWNFFHNALSPQMHILALVITGLGWTILGSCIVSVIHNKLCAQNRTGLTNLQGKVLGSNHLPHYCFLAALILIDLYEISRRQGGS